MTTPKPIYRPARAVHCQPPVAECESLDKEAAPEGLSLGYPNGCLHGERSGGVEGDSCAVEGKQNAAADGVATRGCARATHRRRPTAGDDAGRPDSNGAVWKVSSRAAGRSGQAQDPLAHLWCDCGRDSVAQCLRCGRWVCVWHSAGSPNGRTLDVACHPSCDYGADEMRREWGAP